jgi:hypothetical protein
MGIRASAERFMHMVTSATPPAGQLALFAKNDDSLWVKKSDGSEQTVGGLVGSIPSTSITLNGSGWAGSVRYAKFGNVVTLWLDATKTSWAINDAMLTAGGLPVGIRPVNGYGGFNAGYGVNAAVNNDHRNWWVDIDGSVKAALAGTGSIWGTITYQVPSIERSTAMNSGAETYAITAGAGAGTVSADTKATVRGGMVTVNVNMSVTAGLAAGSTLFNIPPGFRVADPYQYDTIVMATATEVPWRVVVWPDGRVTTALAIPAGVPVIRGSMVYPAALSAAGLGTLVDTGWVAFTQNTPNVNQTQQYAKYRRVGNTVTVKSVHAVAAGGAIGQWLINVPFDFASGTTLNAPGGVPIGRARAVKTGIAWYEGQILPQSLGAPNRATITDIIGGGGYWAANLPYSGNLGVGDYFTLDYEYEAAPL